MFKNIKIIALSLILIFSFNFNNLFAEDIPVIVISPGKTKQSYSTVGSAVSVITSKDLEESDSPFLGDVLNNSLNGMNHSKSGGYGTISMIMLRGLEKKYSTVYIDGIKMSDPAVTDNSYYLSNVMNSAIDRVEILRGSQSSLYGGGAIGGTINIFTKKGNQGKNKKLQVSTGSNGTQNIAASYGDSNDKHDYFVGANRFVTSGISAMNDNTSINNSSNDEDSYVNNGIIANYGYKFNEDLKFETGLRFSDSFLKYDAPNIKQNDNLPRSDDSEVSYNMKLIKKNGNLTNTLTYNAYDIVRSTINGSNKTANYYGYRDSINLIGVYDINLDTKVIYGLDNEFDKSEGKDDWSSLYETHGEEVYSQYVDLQFRPEQKIYSTVGFRRDYHSVAGEFGSYRGTVAYKIDNLSKIRASYGKGIRLPTLYDYFYGTVAADKQALTAESSKSFDLGYETTFQNINTDFNISVFRIIVDDTITGWQSNTADLGGWTLANSAAKVKTKGIELASLWKPKDNFNLSFNYNYNDTYAGNDCDDPDKTAILCIDEQKVRIPRHYASTGMNYIFKNKLKNSFLVRYSGETRDYGNTINGFADVILDDYITVDYKASYKLFDMYNLSLSATNIFDNNYEETYQYSTMGRSLNLGIKRVY